MMNIFCVLFKKSFLFQDHKDVVPFFSKSFISITFMFRSAIQLELVFVYGVR